MALLIIFLVSLGICAFAFGGGVVINERRYRKTYGLPYKMVNPLSFPSKRILKEFNSLPKDNQPYGNIYSIVKALDTKHGKDALTDHFYDSYFDYEGKDPWHCRCYRVCTYPDVDALYDSILAIKKSLEAQEHAIKVAAVQGGLDDALELVERLKQENDLVKDTTKQLLQ